MWNVKSVEEFSSREQRAFSRLVEFLGGISWVKAEAGDEAGNRQGDSSGKRKIQSNFLLLFEGLESGGVPDAGLIFPTGSLSAVLRRECKLSPEKQGEIAHGLAVL